MGPAVLAGPVVQQPLSLIAFISPALFSASERPRERLAILTLAILLHDLIFITRWRNALSCCCAGPREWAALSARTIAEHYLPPCTDIWAALPVTLGSCVRRAVLASSVLLQLLQIGARLGSAGLFVFRRFGKDGAFFAVAIFEELLSVVTVTRSAFLAASLCSGISWACKARASTRNCLPWTTLRHRALFSTRLWLGVDRTPAAGAISLHNFIVSACWLEALSGWLPLRYPCVWWTSLAPAIDSLYLASIASVLNAFGEIWAGSIIQITVVADPVEVEVLPFLAVILDACSSIDVRPRVRWTA